MFIIEKKLFFPVSTEVILNTTFSYNCSSQGSTVIGGKHDRLAKYLELLVMIFQSNSMIDDDLTFAPIDWNPTKSEGGYTSKSLFVNARNTK